MVTSIHVQLAEKAPATMLVDMIHMVNMAMEVVMEAMVDMTVVTVMIAIPRTRARTTRRTWLWVSLLVLQSVLLEELLLHPLLVGLTYIEFFH